MSTLYSIENKSRTRMIEVATNLIIMFLIISFILFIIAIPQINISGAITLFVSLFFCAVICLIVIPFYILRKKFATSMMIDGRGIFTYNKKNEPVETILYEDILKIQLYDESGAETVKPDLRIRIKNGETSKWKAFPKLYYIGLANKEELRLHFLRQAKASRYKIDVDPTAIIHYQALIKK